MRQHKVCFPEYGNEVFILSSVDKIQKKTKQKKPLQSYGSTADSNCFVLSVTKDCRKSDNGAVGGGGELLLHPS